MSKSSINIDMNNNDHRNAYDHNQHDAYELYVNESPAQNNK